MSTLTYGELFAGYGGLGMGVQSVLGGAMTWCAETDPGMSTLLSQRFPHAPNHGDVTKIDWHTVEPVDVLTGGSPCQDLSHAGKRKGMTDGTRSNLWGSMREAIAVIRPKLVVWENVRGAYSAKADSELELCERCMDSHRRRNKGRPAHALRALGRVVGDLSDLGYDSIWYGLRASDVGAAHQRFRVILLAEPTDPDQPRLEGRRPRPWCARELTPGAGRVEAGVALLPTPAVNDMGAAYTPERWDEWTERMKAKHRNGNGHGKSLNVEAQRIQDRREWAEYGPAVDQHERILGRPAPAPTETGPNGTERLSPAFSEWLMMLPEGHVTGVEGLTRRQQIQALGNGVVPAQAAAATLSWWQDRHL